MDAYLNYFYASSVYEVYFLIAGYGSPLDVRLIRSGTQTPIQTTMDASGNSSYVIDLQENDQLLVRMAVNSPDAYLKSTYTASEGTIAATSEHGLTTTITLMS